ncbi:hypothetical protein AMTRI_Chr01g102510 [Amborella trichopoda]
MPSSSTSTNTQFQKKSKNTGTQAFEDQQQALESRTNSTSTMRPQEAPKSTSQEPMRISNGNKKLVRYKECRKNHAASVGGYSVDGCREFLAGGEEGTAAALTCAACSCHRNFHKREEDGVCQCSSKSTSKR